MLHTHDHAPPPPPLAEGSYVSHFLFHQRGQCGCALRPDWPRAVEARAQAQPRLLRAGARRGRRWLVLSQVPRSLAAFAMPNRKATRNAYYFFVQEKIPELRRRGLPVARVADAIPHCSADWAVRPEGSAGRAVGQAEARPEGQAGGRGRRAGGLEEDSDPVPGGGEPPTPAGANGRLNRSPSKSGPPPAGPGARASLLFPFVSPLQCPPAPEPGRKGEVR